MANFIQQFNAGGITYDLHDSEFIIDTRTASGAALTGETKAAALFDGMQITFWMSYAAASNATLNLTLADGTTTGAIPCYYSGTTRLGTHYAAGNAVHFTYRENVTIGSTTVAHGWWADANYSVSDTNYDIIGTSIPIRTRLNAYCLCGMVGTSGTIAKQTNTVGAGTYWEINAFTQSSGTGTSKKLVPNQGYYPGKIFYYTGSSAITDADSVSGTISGGTNNVDLRYTVNGSTSANIGVTGAPFFLVGSLGSDGLFYPNGHASEATKEWWQCGFPTDLTSTYIYWYVGMMSSKYQCRLSDTNWMLKSDGTKWIVFDGASKVYWDSIEGKPTIPNLPSAPNNDGDYSLNVSSGTASWTAVPASGMMIPFTMGQESPYTIAYNTTVSYADILSAKNNGISIAGSIGSSIGYITASAEETFVPPSGQSGTYTYWKFNYASYGGTQYPGSFTLVGDYYDTTNHTGCKFYVVGNSAEVGIDFPGTVPSSDGSYNLNVTSGYATWAAASSDAHILVMTGTPTGSLTSAPVTTTTPYADYQAAITNHYRLVLSIPLAGAVIELQYQDSQGLNSVVHMDGMVTNATWTASSSNDNVQFQYDSLTQSFANRAFSAGDAAYASSAGEFASSSELSDGVYSLQVSGGSPSWTAASSGGLQPPVQNGDFYLNDDGMGNTTWMSMSGASVSYATSAGSAGSVNWSDVQNQPTIPEVPDAPTSSDGDYVLNVTNGSASWSTPGYIPTTGTLSLTVAGWSGNGPYSQTVVISGTTANSKIDLQPDSTVLSQMTTDGTTALYIENNNGTLTAWAMGAAPTAALTIQYTKTEVA